jgi:hypothetical protein
MALEAWLFLTIRQAFATMSRHPILFVRKGSLPRELRFLFLRSPMAQLYRGRPAELLAKAW